MTQPEPERPKVWQPTWISNEPVTFLGDDADHADSDPENASIDDAVATREDHD